MEPWRFLLPAIFIATSLLLLSPTPSLCEVSFFIPNRALYDIVKDAPSHPTDEIVRDWLYQLQGVIEGCVSFVFSARLAQVLVRRANILKWKVKKATGSAKRQQYLQLLWELKVMDNEVHSMGKENQDAGSRTKSSRKRTRKDSYSKRHERRLKHQRRDLYSRALSELAARDDITPVQVIYQHNVSKEMGTVVLDKDLAKALHIDGQKVGPEEEEILNMMLYIKDRHHISISAYHEMCSICKELPRSYKIKQKIRELNTRWKLFETPPGTVGVQQSLRERLTICLEYLVEKAPKESPLFREKKVRVKLTGDGTNIGRHLHVVNFAFTILEEEDKAYGPSGNHCIAIFKEGEDYSSMKKCLQNIVDEMKTIAVMNIGGYLLDIEFYLGGDWKFLAMITGIDSATSTYACIWCKCPALERFDSSQTWSIQDATKGARTIEENVQLAKAKGKSKYNVSNEPIFSMVPLTRVVVDNLHMFLRVSDTLIDLLLLELRRLDAITKATKLKSLDALHFIKLFESTLKMIGVSGFSFWIGKESKMLKCRTLTGPEKLLLFKKLKVAETFPRVPDCEKVENLWQKLLSINEILSIRPSAVTTDILELFEQESKEFVRLFVDVYPSKHVTPYMHCMMQHVREFFELHGCLMPFTQQGLEKYNDQMTKDYFRSSSHRGTECLIQILQKQNRIEHLEYIGARRQVRPSKCSKCQAQGHNSRTCTNPSRGAQPINIITPPPDYLNAIDQPSPSNMDLPATPAAPIQPPAAAPPIQEGEVTTSRTRSRKK